MTYLIASSASGESRMTLRPAPAVTNAATLGKSLPSSIGKDELFFWTRKWQEGEAESAAERAAGRARTFSSGDDAIRWLLDCDD